MEIETAGEFLRENTQVDLHDALDKSIRTQTVKPSQLLSSSFRPLGLPARVWDAVHDQPNEHCPMGLLPLIDSAWAFVDARLILWQINSKEKPLEHWLGCSENVTCVEVVQPKRGVFSKLVLIMCCESKVSMFEVYFRKSGASKNLELRSLPMYSCSTAGKVFTTICCTSNGRVFMGSKCGQLCELWYGTSAGHTAKASLCSLATCSSSFWDRLPLRIVSKASAVKQLVVDDERRALYILHENSCIEVYDLGADACGKPNKVAHCKDVYAQGTSVPMGHEILQTHKPVTVSSISVIPSHASKKLQFACLTTRGHRIYFTTMAAGPSANSTEDERLPTKLRALFVAKSPVNLQENSAYGSKTHQAHHMVRKNGMMLFTGSCGDHTALTNVHLIVPLKCPQDEYCESNHGAAAVSQGPPIALVSWEAHGGGELHWYRKLVGNHLPPQCAQYFEKDLKFVLLTQRGLVEIEVHWPASHIFRALEGGKKIDLEAFSHVNGGVETAAVCAHVGAVGKSSVAKAEALLALTAEIPGARAMEGNHGVGVRSDQSNLVGTVPICFADAAVGIGLYIKRCLGLIWQDTLFQECSSDTGGVGIKVAWPKDLMQWYHEWCMGAAEMIDEVIAAVKNSHVSTHALLSKDQEDCVSLLKNLRQLVKRSGHVMGLMDIFCKCSLSVLPAIEKPRDRERLLSMTLDEAVSVDAMDSPLNRLILDLVLYAGKQQWQGGARTQTVRDSLMQKLEEKSSLFFGGRDRQFIKAHDILMEAKNLQKEEMNSKVSEALTLLLKIPQAIMIAPITQALYDCYQYKSIVTVCMAVAKARDPGGVAFKKPNSFRAIHAAGLRKPCYSAILDLVDYSFKSSQTCDAWKATLKAVLLECAREYDPLLLRQLCDYMEKQKSIHQILVLSSSNITRFLLAKSGLEGDPPTSPIRLESTQRSWIMLLAEHYRLIGDFKESSHLYWRLGGQLSKVAIGERVHLYKQAIAAAEHFDDIDFMDQLLDDLEHSELQSTAYDYQANKLGKPALELDGLQNSTVELAELLKIFSECGEMHDLCIRCLALTPNVEGHDQLLASHWESFIDSFGPAQPSQLEALCNAIGFLGAKLRGGFITNLSPFVSVRLESIIFYAPRESDSREKIISTPKKYKDLLFNALLKACGGAHHMLFRVYCDALNFVANDQSRDWRLKMELFRTILRLCWLLQSGFSEVAIHALGREATSIKQDIQQFIHNLDEFATTARMIAPGQDEALFEIYSGFHEIKMNLRANLNKNRPLFLKDAGCTFNESC